MGNYYATATKFKLKEDTPEVIKDFFDTLYGVKSGEIEKHEFLQQLPDINDLELQISVWGVSSYHEAHCARGKEDGSYYSFASTKSSYIELYKKIFAHIFKHLVLNPGEVLYTQVYEDSPEEEFLYIDSLLETIQQSQIKIYKTLYNLLTDSTHPWNLQKDIDTPMMKIKNFFDLI